MTRSLKTKTELVERKSRDHEDLLFNILPRPAALRRMEGDAHVTETYSDVTVLFADVNGFDELTEERGSDEALTLPERPGRPLR